MDRSFLFNKKLIGILSVVFALLLFGSITMNSVVGNGGVNAIGWIVVLAILFLFFNKEANTQAIMIMLFFLSFYDYSSEKGGLWNYVFFIFIGFFVAENKIRIAGDKIFRTFAVIVAALVIIGIFCINPGAMGDKISYFLVFMSFILFFSIAKSVLFNFSFFKLFTAIVLITSVMQFLICINERFEFTHTSLPFFPTQEMTDTDFDLREENLGTNKVRNWGSLGDFEAFGEVNAMFFIFYLTFLVRQGQVARRLKLFTPIRLILVFTTLCVLLSGTRSSVLMIAIFTFIIYLFNLKQLFNWQFFGGLAVLALIFMLSGNFVYEKLGLNTLTKRLNFLSETNVDVTTGEGTNRQGPYDLGLHALASNSHVIGNGYAFGGDYRTINNSGSASIEFMDAHNLYLTIPLYLGWIGSAIFLFAFIYAIYRCTKIKGMLALPFAFMWISFLLNQAKIVFIRHPHYECLIIVFLGFTYAYCRSYKIFEQEIREQIPKSVSWA
jgi:O-Antigen ligase